MLQVIWHPIFKFNNVADGKQESHAIAKVTVRCAPYGRSYQFAESLATLTAIFLEIVNVM